MNKPALVIGLALIAVGLGLFVIQSINSWNCAHSSIPTSCPNPEFVREILDYPLIAIGLVFMAYSFLSSRHHPHPVNREETEKA
jgi:hypothetical protein